MTMLEKAAKALWDWDEQRLGSHTPWENAHDEAGKGVIRDEVRAVLRAIRDPDDAMRRAIAVLISDHPEAVARNLPIAGAFWQAGIDSILAERP